MQFLNNIPTDYTLTSFFKPFYELYSVKALPTTLTVDRAFGRVMLWILTLTIRSIIVGAVRTQTRCRCYVTGADITSVA